MDIGDDYFQNRYTYPVISKKGADILLLKITTPRVVFDLQLNRRVTIIRGESATGKSWIHAIIRELDDVSFVECERKVVIAPVPVKGREKAILPQYNGCVILIDENHKYALTEAYAEAVMENDIWVVISAREVKNYPYSADEVYSIKTSGKYKHLVKYYTEPVNKHRYTEKILTEDEGGGNKFFRRLGYKAKPAQGKDNIPKMLERNMLVSFDKSAIGYIYDKLYSEAAVKGTLDLVEPESFEWVLLHSDIFNRLPEVKAMLKNPEDYGANNHKTWENFFTYELSKLLSKHQKANYNKGHLSRCFTEDCCVKSEPCGLDKTGHDKLRKLAKVMGVDYLLDKKEAEHIREMLPESMTNEYSDEELINKFSHLL